MGVYIPNKAKPKKCGQCPCAYFTEGALSNVCQITGDDIDDIGELLKNCPIEEVDLVRCEECAWYEKPYCRWHDRDNKPTDFCSYGERRNDE